MEWFCSNCGKYGEVDRHHVLHRSQAGQGTYVQILCKGTGSCHSGIEFATLQSANSVFANNASATGSLPHVIGSQIINGVWMYQYAERLAGTGSGFEYAYDRTFADIRVFNPEGSLAGSGQITPLGSCSLYVAGSPALNSAMIIISSRWTTL